MRPAASWIIGLILAKRRCWNSNTGWLQPRMNRPGVLTLEKVIERQAVRSIAALALLDRDQTPMHFARAINGDGYAAAMAMRRSTITKSVRGSIFALMKNPCSTSNSRACLSL